MNTNIIKIIKICFIMIVAGVFWYACAENEHAGPQKTDSVSPGIVSEIKVLNISGGAILTYTLPDDEDLLYVKAIYTRNGETCESRTSVYRDSLRIEGFGDTQSREVKVISVDRSENESAPVSVTIQPLEPDVLIVGKSLEMRTYFGGVDAVWENPNCADISVNVLMENDSLMEYVSYETFYSAIPKDIGAIRELDTVPYKFGVYAQDHWGNKSEVKYYELSPLYEAEFENDYFASATLPNDGTPLGNNMSELWDEVWGTYHCYSTVVDGAWPHSVTIDLGVPGKISRIRIYQRICSYCTWGEGTPQLFEIWGCLDEPDPSGSWDSWTKLMECESIKPSGLPGTQYDTDKDLPRAMEGEDFYNENIETKVRYIRFRIYETWSTARNIQMGEVRVFGDYR